MIAMLNLRHAGHRHDARGRRGGGFRVAAAARGLFDDEARHGSKDFRARRTGARHSGTRACLRIASLSKAQARSDASGGIPPASDDLHRGAGIARLFVSGGAGGQHSAAALREMG